MPAEIPVNRILPGDCIEVLNSLPEKCVDLIFADPPYNLQLQQALWRPDMTKVDAVDDAWDRFAGFEEYDEFSRAWLSACRRVLKDNGTIWVIGTYHNIYRLGAIMQDLGFWFLNDIIWVKANPMPNFRGVRFTNAHETLLWASKNKGARHTFNHHAMKALNDGVQMRSDWRLPICSGAERLKANGKKAHSTQKPEALLTRVLLSSSNPGEIVLDPFFGSGTTGAVATKLGRRWIGIERDPAYIEIAQKRIESVTPQLYEKTATDLQDRKRSAPRIPMSTLITSGLLRPGQHLFFQGDLNQTAEVKADGKLVMDGFVGSIHQCGRRLTGGRPCNGWEHWYYEDKDGKHLPIDNLREMLREGLKQLPKPEKAGAQPVKERA